MPMIWRMLPRQPTLFPRIEWRHWPFECSSWNLEFGSSLDVGAWILEFSPALPSRFNLSRFNAPAASGTNPSINVDILFGRARPRKICGQRVLPEVIEQRRLLIQSQPFPNRLGQGGGGIVFKLDPICFLAVSTDVHHRIVQSSGLAHDRHRTIAQAVPLL